MKYGDIVVLLTAIHLCQLHMHVTVNLHTKCERHMMYVLL